MGTYSHAWWHVGRAVDPCLLLHPYTLTTSGMAPASARRDGSVAPGDVPAPCPFCIGGQDVPGSDIVAMDDKTVILIHPDESLRGHFLIMPRQHFNHIRAMDEATVEALIATVNRVVRAVDLEFPGEQISIRKSTDAAAGHGVPHIHFHLHLHRTDHPQAIPGNPALQNRHDIFVERVRQHLSTTRAAQKTPDNGSTAEGPAVAGR